MDYGLGLISPEFADANARLHAGLFLSWRAPGAGPLSVAVAALKLFTFCSYSFREEGPAGLEDRCSRPHRSPRRLAQQTEDHILAVRCHQRWGPQRLSAVVHVPRSTVYAVLVRHGCSRLTDFDRMTAQPIRYVRPQPEGLDSLSELSSCP